MPSQEVKRKLAAILSADVKGYSRLMREDEEGTLRTLNEYKEVMFGFIRQFRGRVVGTAGDSVLAEYSSVVDAVRCAIEIQKELRARNSDLPDDRKMEFRIGINLGDVIEEGDTIYGDGVNIAARIQSLAEGGGISISGTVYEHVEKRLRLRYEYSGEQTVKNIDKPIQVYRVSMDIQELPDSKAKVEGKKPKSLVAALAVVVVAVAVVTLWQFVWRSPSPKIEVASKEKMAFPLPDKPSIAVLPFTNMSEDPKQEYLADGLAEEIINGLSKVEHIFVIARNSTFTYKGKSVKVQQVAQEMSVRYVLEGSVRKSGDKVRITAQLIDALTGNYLFSERYDRDLKDILILQDEITIKVLTAVQVKLTGGEDARLRSKSPTNLEAYLKFLQAGKYSQTHNKESIALARQLLEEAIALDPQFAAAYSMLCRVTMLEANLGLYKNPPEAFERALELGKRAVELDDSSSNAHAWLCWPYIFLREQDKALAEAEKAVSFGPNSASAYFALASALYYSERFQEAIPFFEKSLRLSPIPVTSGVLMWQGHAYRQLGRYEEAVAAYKKMLQLYPNHLYGHLGLAAAYYYMGREKEARAEAAEALRIDPEFSLEDYARFPPFKSQAAIDNYIEPLRKLGLK